MTRSPNPDARSPSDERRGASSYAATPPVAPAASRSFLLYQSWSSIAGTRSASNTDEVPRSACAASLARPLAPGERIDLDRADVTEITRLPRIGPALAQRIVAWRAEHGAFGSLARLDSVSGVGPRLLDAVRPWVTFSGIPPAAP